MSAQTIFEQLRRAGMTPTGALASMGNMREESNLEACRLQGDFQTDRWPSQDYARRVDNGLIDAETYAKDGKGWGLVQFTWSGYKRGLLKLCKERGASIADEAAQVDYLISVLKTEFPSLWSFLCSCDEDQLYEATSRFCKEFERPAYNNVDVRFYAARDLRDELQGMAVENIDNTVTDASDKYWPPRMICKSMFGDDVAVLQALLRAHGYTLSDSSGIFGESTETALITYQADHGLDADGIAGPMTWASITRI